MSEFEFMVTPTVEKKLRELAGKTTPGKRTLHENMTSISLRANGERGTHIANIPYGPKSRTPFAKHKRDDAAYLAALYPEVIIAMCEVVTAARENCTCTLTRRRRKQSRIHFSRGK